MRDRRCVVVAGNSRRIVQIEARHVFLRECLEFLYAFVVCLGRIRDSFFPARGDKTLGIFEPGRHQGRSNRAGVRVDDEGRLPAEARDLADGLRGEFRRAQLNEDIGAARLEFHDLVLDRGLGHFMANLFDDHLRRPIAKPELQSAKIVLAKVVVDILNGNLRVRFYLEQIPAEYRALSDIGRIERNDPGEALRIIEPDGSGRKKEARHAFGVEVLRHSGIRRRSEEAGDRKYLIGFDELARLFDRLRRAERVVERYEVDLAAVDPATIIDHLEIGRLGLSINPVRGCRTAVRRCGAQLDLGVGDTNIVVLGGTGSPGNAYRLLDGSESWDCRKTGD